MAKQNWSAESRAAAGERSRMRHADPVFRAKHAAHLQKLQAKLNADPELRAKQVAGLRKAVRSPEFKVAAADRLQKQNADPGFQQKRSAGAQKKHLDPEFRAAHADRLRKRNADPGFQAKILQKWNTDPELRESRMVGIRKAMANPEFQARRVAGLQQRSRKILFMGALCSYTDLAELAGCNMNAMFSRIRKLGMTPENAVAAGPRMARAVTARQHVTRGVTVKWSEERRAAAAETMRKLRADPDFQARLKAKLASEDSRLRRAEITRKKMLKLNADPVFRKRAAANGRAQLARLNADPAYRERRASRLKQLYVSRQRDDPNFMSRVRAAGQKALENPAVQERIRSAIQQHHRKLLFLGTLVSYTDLAALAGCQPTAIKERIRKRGMTPEQAVAAGPAIHGPRRLPTNGAAATIHVTEVE
jgi:hypothetical protein